MSTKIYGASDDLIEFEGDFRGEVGHYSSDDEGCLLVISDGTLLEATYNRDGIWKLSLVKKGSLFEKIDQCDDADADPHSDVAHFGGGVKWAYAASKWEKVA